MKNLLVFNLLIWSFAVFSAEVLKIDTESSELKWTGEKVTGKHFGKVSFKSGELHKDDDGALEKGKFIVDMTSITVDDLSGEWQQKLVNHLNSKDFFQTSTHKEAVLEMTSLKKLEGKTYEVKGKLTIKETTHDVSFMADIDMSESSIKATGELKFDRTKYDIKYGSGKFFEDLGDKMIYDDVKVSFDIAAKK